MSKVLKSEKDSDSDSDSEEIVEDKIGARAFNNKVKQYDLDDTLSSSSSDGEDLIKFSNMSIASKKKIISKTKSKLCFRF
jgi:hypothetical protein